MKIRGVLAVISGVLILAALFFFFPRRPIINLLKIDTGVPQHSDLIAVLGGGIAPGGKLGRSTRERLNGVIAYTVARNHQCPVLVLEYPAGRRKMISFLVRHGLDRGDVLRSGFHYREQRGGTENNIAELFHVLRFHRGIKQVLLVTSPYHQRRVQLMLKSFLTKEPAAKEPAAGEWRFYFLQLASDGEIFYCSRWRFWRLVSHEALGIFFLKLKE